MALVFIPYRVHPPVFIPYRHALRAWKAGERDSVFPVGTWWMRVHHGARTELQPAPG